MKKYFVSIFITAFLAISAVIIGQTAQAQNTSPQSMGQLGALTAAGATNSDQKSPPILAAMPGGYRDWKLISVAHEEASLNDIRAILGNDIAVKAYREGTLPFPEGSIIARISWMYEPSEENNKIFGRVQSFIAGPPTNGVQFMIKDSKKYAATGGWGYAQFNDGKPIALSSSCFVCHQLIKERDFVFTRYAP